MPLPKRAKKGLKFSSTIDVRFTINIPQNLEVMTAKMMQGAKKRIVKEVANEIHTQALRNISKYKLYDLGDLQRGEYKVPDGDDYIVGNEAPHAAPVNDGSGPAVGHQAFCPPIEPLLDWARRNIAVSGRGSKKTYTIRGEKGRRAKKGPTEEMAEVLRIARAIQFNIMKHGQQPRPFFDDAIQTVRAKIPAITSTVFQAYLKEKGIKQFDDMFKKQSKKFIKTVQGGKKGRGK